MAILITGGSKGIGRAIGKRFAEEGDDVFINYHSDDEAAQDAAEEVEAAGGHAFLVKGDVSTPEGAQDVVDEVAAEADQLDQLVHCAVDPLSSPILDVDPERFTEAVTLNGVGLLYMAQAAFPLLDEGSTIFFMSSRGSDTVVPAYAALGTSKAFGECLIRYLAKELAPHGIRANTVAAGPLDTEAIHSVLDNADERLAAAAEANPSGRGLAFDDVTEAVYWIASPEAEMVQGQLLFVDGGLYL
ncbi:SDR family oxidoreductase [Halomarina oriensis]|uniref:SDR family oxidoreductase n=1 Tax=Halomarina oriensis TaxID=671145 RepID=A0A6B0GKX2_9EURY|nr:SDR family oxidoreductase [Halomarina oriensis]MWG33443.1 SDR family oxidoreductase [Halomarina oriensis]